MALSWAVRRQFMVVGGFVAIVIIIAAIVIIPKFNVKPTCSDNKQNGTEQGVDCGGGCTKLCPFQTADVVVRWARVFPVTSTVANAAAYISNPNISAAARNVPYQFKIYDADHNFITERDGVAYIAPNGNSAIFEGGIQVGSRVPASVDFKFTSNPLWVSIDPRVATISVVAKGATMADTDSKPKLSGTITNNSQKYGVNNVTAVGILYDANDNAVGVSNTYTESLAPQETDPVYFTWPQPFAATPVRSEILPRFDVFNVNFN